MKVSTSQSTANETATAERRRRVLGAPGQGPGGAGPDLPEDA